MKHLLLPVYHVWKAEKILESIISGIQLYNKKITRSENIVWNKIPVDAKTGKTDISSLLSKRRNISFTGFTSTGILFQTMFSLLVIILVRKIFARKFQFLYLLLFNLVII